MCIAIAKSAGVFMDVEELATCFKNNPDGAGFAYVDENHEIQIEKYMHFGEFAPAYLEKEALYPESPFLIHFRIRTHGETSLINCHPFQINEDMAFIHNGTIKGVPDDKVLSDTQMFNQHVLQKLPEGWEDSEGVKTMIEEFISWSKLVVLHRDKGLIIYNESKGNWNKDKTVWYSNYSNVSRSTSTSWSYYDSEGNRTASRGGGGNVTHLSDKRHTGPHKKCDWCFGWPQASRVIKLEWKNPTFSDEYICLDCFEKYIEYQLDISLVANIIHLKNGLRRDIEDCWECGKRHGLLDRTKTGGNFCSLTCEDKFFQFHKVPFETGEDGEKKVIVLR